MKTKILVNEMPKEPTDCPFAIKNERLVNLPFVCDLKRDKESDIRFGGINFGFSRHSNCVLKTKGCDMLCVITNIT